MKITITFENLQNYGMIPYFQSRSAMIMIWLYTSPIMS